jgi:hypothetical protein
VPNGRKADTGHGRKLTAAERTTFAKVSGDRAPPRRKVTEFVVSASRRAGKGRAGAALMVYEACLVNHAKHLAPGEVGVCAAISPTRAQAAILIGYCRGYLESSPLLRGEITEISADEIRLRNSCVICVLTADFRSLRGRTLLFALLDEAAFLRDETSATPDVEAARALRPGLLTTGGMLAVMSSPYRRAGLLHQRVRDYFGKDDPGVLVVSGASTDFNPTLSATAIEAERLSDPAAAVSEWFGGFRNDIAQFLDDALVDAAIDADRPLELAPRANCRYVAGVDMSGGRHDGSTLCIAHAEGDGDDDRCYVVDVVTGRLAPHDPAQVAREFAALCRDYRVTQIVGDNFAGEWVSGAFYDAGLDYLRSELVRSDLYLEGLPCFVRGQVSIPNHPALVRELRGLERRTTRAGRDSVDHGAGAGSHDDHANAVFCALNQIAAVSASDRWATFPALLASTGQAAESDPDTTLPVNSKPWRPNAAVAAAPRAPREPTVLDGFLELQRIAREAASGGPAVQKAPVCASCRKPIMGPHQSDGALFWCGRTCESAWSAAQLARKQALAPVMQSGAINPGAHTRYV